MSFTPDHARIASEAKARFGKGTGSGGGLNMLYLMVYAVAMEREVPLLCMGRDFAATEVVVHRASRVG